VETILSVLQVIISVIVVFLVLMHSGKDSGLSGAFGVGSGTVQHIAREMRGECPFEDLNNAAKGVEGSRRV